MTTDVSTNPNHIYQRYLLAKDESQIIEDSLWLGEEILFDAPESLSLKGKNLWIAGGITPDGGKKQEEPYVFHTPFPSSAAEKGWKNSALVLQRGDGAGPSGGRGRPGGEMGFWF